MEEEKNLNLSTDDLLKIIQKCAFDAFFITDRDGKILFVNDSYERITGQRPTSLLGHNISMLRKLGILETNVAEKVRETKQPMSMMLNYKNKKNVLVTAIPVFNSNNEYIASVGNIRDMTELNNLKAKLAQVKNRSTRIEQELLELKLQQLLLESEYVYHSREMRALIALAVRIAKVESTVLITGESGVGKGVYARLIYQLSGYEDSRPYVKISCGAIPETLLESELFGYESGAFTGAKKEGKTGIFEVAGNGIVFLDEIGELPLSLQVKLLTVIQDREFTRVGGTQAVKLNARIIAATNKNLEEAVKQGEFRKDLYFRLNVIPVEIPPLRERREDIVPLTVLFVNKLNEKYKLNRSMDNIILDIFEEYPWPGNVRELANIVERLVVLSPQDIITEDYLPDKLKFMDANDFHTIDDKLNLKDFLGEMEKYRISKAINNNQSIKDVAVELGIDSSTLTRKIQKYGIPHRNQLKYIHTENTKLKI